MGPAMRVHGATLTGPEDTPNPCKLLGLVAHNFVAHMMDLQQQQHEPKFVGPDSIEGSACV